MQPRGGVSGWLAGTNAPFHTASHPPSTPRHCKPECLGPRYYHLCLFQRRGFAWALNPMAWSQPSSLCPRAGSTGA